MSIVSARWGTRRSPRPAVPAAPVIDARLAELGPGATATIVDIDGSLEPSAARRLFDLGFVPGSEVTVLRRAPLGDPMIFEIAEYEVALRRAQARGIRVRPTV